MTRIELALEGMSRSKHSLTLLYRFDRVVYTSTLWYPTVDFDRLESVYGKELLDKVLFHIYVFHGQKIQSLKPTHLLLGAYGRHWNPRVARLWARSTQGTLGQWRFESGNLDYPGAQVVADDAGRQSVPPAAIVPGTTDLLMGNGGGKDSLVMAKLLDRGGVPFDTFSINFHTDADPVRRVEHNERFLHRLAAPPAVNHPQYVVETFLNSPSARLHGIPGHSVSQIRNDEDTPMAHGFFDALPIMLDGGYTQLVFGNERSADSANLVVDGESVNHAWSKTVECESLFTEYIREELVANFSAYSLLKPCSDVFIYRALAELAGPGDIASVHSCNIDPPWCRSCPKCAYVWLSYRAYLPGNPEVREVFGDESPFTRPQLRRFYRQLLGLEGHKPFECVGEIDETRLAFELCVRAGESHGAVEDYVRGCRLTPGEFADLWSRYNSLDWSYRAIPRGLADILREQEKRMAENPVSDHRAVRA
ncbi:hypothetical protein ACWY4P_14520 [Streptomyces sp. LZ34]